MNAPWSASPRLRRVALVVSTACAGAGCRTSAADVEHSSAPAATSARLAPSQGSGAGLPGAPGPNDGTAPAPSGGPDAACQSLWEATLELPELPGNPDFEARRATLLMRAKAEPVLFLATPELAPTENAAAMSHRAHLARATRHWDALAFALARFRARPDLGRAVLLRDGYLYAEHPHLAYAMDQQVRPEHLFDAERIWLQRGQHVFRARRAADGTYVYENSSPEPLEPVSLLHLDRLGEGDPPPPLHVDLRTLRDRLGFERLHPVRLTRDHLLVRLDYDGHPVRTVLRAEGARLDVVCEWIADAERSKLREAKSRAKRRREALVRLQRAMHEQVVDALPFDEPKNEVGNEDGSLRGRWWRAYTAGRNGFEHDGETYGVWNRFGRARPPQVCVDFVTDTFERASGTWFAPRGEPPERRVGTLDLAPFEALTLRRVPNLLRFAEEQSDWFEVLTTEFDQRTALGRRERFFAELERAPERYVDGDVVIVRGPTTEDPDHLHYHSFFIYETDPLSGVPIAIVGNSGHPHVWSLEDESRRAPKRSIWHRIRPRRALLEKIAGAAAPPVSLPTPLVEESPAPSDG